MKHHFFYLLLYLLTIPLFSFGQKSPVITFESKVCNFGTIKYKPMSRVKIKFFFSNTGNSPLIIYNIDATCGCTVPSWTKKPIPSGTKDSISVIFKINNRASQITKTLFVKSNSTEKVTVLHIKGSII